MTVPEIWGYDTTRWIAPVFGHTPITDQIQSTLVSETSAFPSVTRAEHAGCPACFVSSRSINSRRGWWILLAPACITYNLPDFKRCT